MKINRKMVGALAAILLSAACSVTPEPAPPGPSLPLPGSAPSLEADMPESQPDPGKYLEQLRAQGVPISTTGKPEIQIGTGICRQVRGGANPRALARDLTSIGWTAEQATAVVTAAQQHLC